MTEHLLKENYRDDDKLREAYYAYIKTVFPSADFKSWYERGYWPPEFIQYSLVKDGRVLSNVSVSKMNILLNGKTISGVQIGAVGTIPEFCRQGLSRYLMEHVIEKYQKAVDLIFLFANETVIDFYPKFGFTRHDESVFIAKSDIPKPEFAARKLEINNAGDMALVEDYLARRQDLTVRFGARGYDKITLWHVLNLHPERLWYVEEDGVIVIANEKEGHLHVWDVIFSRPIDLSAVLPKIIKSDTIQSIRYYFAPDVVGYGFDETEIIDDSPLFTLGEFDIGDGPLKFPATAQT